MADWEDCFLDHMRFEAGRQGRMNLGWVYLPCAWSDTRQLIASMGLA